jgi:hypothetical protein
MSLEDLRRKQTQQDKIAIANGRGVVRRGSGVTRRRASRVGGDLLGDSPSGSMRKLSASSSIDLDVDDEERAPMQFTTAGKARKASVMMDRAPLSADDKNQTLAPLDRLGAKGATEQQTNLSTDTRRVSIMSKDGSETHHEISGRSLDELANEILGGGDGGYDSNNGSNNNGSNSVTAAARRASVRARRASRRTSFSDEAIHDGPPARLTLDSKSLSGEGGSNDDGKIRKQKTRRRSIGLSLAERMRMSVSEVGRSQAKEKMRAHASRAKRMSLDAVRLNDSVAAALFSAQSEARAELGEVEERRLSHMQEVDSLSRKHSLVSMGGGPRDQVL